LIETPLSVTNASFSGTSMNATEDNYTVINLWVQDDDFKVAASQKTYYNESLTINLTIEGPNTNLFSFNINGAFPSPGNNRSLHTATFTPTKTDVGDYNVTINVTDINGASDFFAFNLSINETSHAPVLDSLVNKTTAVNQTLYYDINATDAEDGNESTGNLTYSYNFISGIDFINNNQTIFNTTSGILNITFNDSQSGAYRLNITVNDTVGSIDFDSFWIYVYASPNITFPASAEVFTLQENVTSSLNFTVNNSVGDNLTYYFYINSVLRYNLSYYGNNTNLTWAFTPNFTDETYGNYTNLTLIVYPSSENLANAINYNTTQSWNTNITHLNSPVEFSGNIGDKQGTYGTGIEINLSGYFTDIDHSDIFYNQPVSFSIKSNTTPSYITSSVSSDWILTLSSIVATSELINVTGNDSSTNATSNNFFVEFTPPVVVTTPSSGSSKTRPVSLKIIMPGPISSFKKERVVVPIKLVNNGIINLNGITLFGEISKDNVVRDDIFLYFDQFEFVSLPAGVEEETNLTIDVNTEEVGTYEITINATVDSPIYNDWGKIYLTVQEGVKIEERILFTEEFIADNPECLELQELVEEAKRLSAAGEPELARLKTEEAINACKETISQQGRSKLRDIVENNLYRYLLFGTIFSFFVGLSYYSYRRMQLRKRTFSINNLKRNEKIIKIKESI